MVEITIDGIIFMLQTHGGISRLYKEVLPRMCSIDDALKAHLIIDGNAKQSLPNHENIDYCVVPTFNNFQRPYRVWKRIRPYFRKSIRNFYIGKGKGKIWHSTYFTKPDHWSGYQVVTVVDMIYELFPNFYNDPIDHDFREKKRECVESADAIICISETTLRDLKSVYGEIQGAAYVIPLACSDSFRKIDFSINNDSMLMNWPFLLYVGRRTRYKNFSRLLKAYELLKYNDEIHLVAVGDPCSSSEADQIITLGIKDKVHFLPHISDVQLCRLYNQAVALVYPSMYEGFGIPLLEAMACGCPIVASDIPTTNEIAGSFPYYFQATDVDSLMIALEDCLDNGRDPELINAGLKTAGRFSWYKTALDTLNVYYELSD